MNAYWNGEIIAQSDETIVIENNYYFPPDSIIKEFFAPSDTHTICGWKGEASYYDVIVGGTTNSDAAWYYPAPKDEAKEIKDYVAFWKDVEIVD